MDETIRELVRAFEKMADSFHLLAQRLSRQVEELQEHRARLEAQLQEVEGSNRGLREANLGLGRVIADLELKVQELSRSHEELKRQDRLKSDFLATVSHELKTPLTALKGSLNILLEGGAAPEVQQELLLMALQNSERLSRLVTNLLDLAKLEAGRMELEVRSLDLPQLIRAAVGMLRGAAQEKEIEVQLVYPEEMPPVLADEERLLSVLTNLLENAIKFSPQKGRIGVEVSLEEQEVLVAVKDEGPGIPEAELPRVFNRFYQAEAAPRGFGLGLSISKAIVEEHRGRIWAESGRWGSRFCFTLPRQKP